MKKLLKWIGRKLGRTVERPFQIGDVVLCVRSHPGYYEAGKRYHVDRMFPANDGSFWFVRVSGEDGEFIPSSHAGMDFSPVLNNLILLQK